MGEEIKTDQPPPGEPPAPADPPVQTPPAAPPPAEKIPTVNLTEKPSAAEDLISKANTAAARQEAANAELSKLLDRQEAMKVEQTLGGKTDAGQPQKETTPQEYAKKIMAGENPNDTAQ